jgi:hypothetical protein
VIGTSAKGHGTKIFLQHVFMELQVFLAEFGKTYIIFIEIRHGKCSFMTPGTRTGLSESNILKNVLSQNYAH